ncbi:hypothetical protein BU26DRAFT_180861 [Trematosphaeria pertusa]|uniref:Uncharacterized protein n=1 Tax=Trematosphaeria pertusa TaxID=390896 RepID=A0A6A6HTB0_9PLEO|nr:uncharacterized protein BU26DRAFT_180861 [Trematosphaeria pertusa]KAF2241139.1 hypothetical protein BU26DRAFT_180861 [Trematosphaeria pertusa]
MTSDRRPLPKRQGAPHRLSWTASFVASLTCCCSQVWLVTAHASICCLGISYTDTRVDVGISARPRFRHPGWLQSMPQADKLRWRYSIDIAMTHVHVPGNRKRASATRRALITTRNAHRDVID